MLNDSINKPNKFFSKIKKIFHGKSKLMANASTDKRPCLNICSCFSSAMPSKLKKSTKLLTDFTWRYTPKSPPKATKTLRFLYISVLFVQKERDCGSIISKPFCHIINLSIRSGKFPSSWKAATVTPIFKFGSPTLPENDRSISVLPVVTKFLEKAVQQVLKDYFETENLLFKNQDGFRKKHSTKMVSI